MSLFVRAGERKQTRNTLRTADTPKELLIAAAKSGSIELWQAVTSEVSKRRRRSSRLMSTSGSMLESVL